VILTKVDPAFFRNAPMWVELIENEFRSNSAIWVLIVSMAKLMCP